MTFIGKIRKVDGYWCTNGFFTKLKTILYEQQGGDINQQDFSFNLNHNNRGKIRGTD